ncbi:DUF3040 family protein [Pseudonocardia hierapolitana]|uniref:DUF3040 family protein n=1 Tax=Pseudonocardia hierapolitana TaxID=1128676 RepID=A0A561T4Z0_9PSEU|nr:DUF3040 domain-containing protein [Pseudonocardia hierapolitana]TWF82178.1 DUF3040 family protein [Pseudonocardia hierapolitana]
MLSDQERQTLDEVQRRFVTEDPRFAASFNRVGPGASSYTVRWVPRWAYTTAMFVAAAFGVLMLIAGAPGTALAVAALATAISLLRPRRNQTGRRES